MTSILGRTTEQEEEKFKEIARYLKVLKLPGEIQVQPDFRDASDELMLPEIFCQELHGTAMMTTWWDFRNPESVDLQGLDAMFEGY